jgi:hypothetical protein
MESRRTLLEQLATSLVGSRVAVAHTPASFDGETRVETRNTVYRLKDGVCIHVSQKDQRGAGARTDVVGMRVVGWLLPGGAPATVVHAWRPGTYAVLWRPGGKPSDATTFALTSATVAFVAERSLEPRRSMRPTSARPLAPPSVPPSAPAPALRPALGSSGGRPAATPRVPAVSPPSGATRTTLTPPPRHENPPRAERAAESRPSVPRPVSPLVVRGPLRST